MLPMATAALGTVLHDLRRSLLRQDEAGLTDSELLECLVTRRDEDAFAALVRRHGPMVLGVCRRVLRNEADAEDAFQATFFVLVRKAASIRPRGMVGNWLYGVAHRTALKARAMSTKRLAKEREAAARPKPDVTGEIWQELQVLLDQELKVLPDIYRAAIVLCDLEGKSIKEAARQLDCPQGTVGTRLARGRILLSRRLARHGLPLSGGVIATVIAQNAAAAGVPPLLINSTVKAATLIAAGQATATGMISAKVAALTEGVLKTMLLTKLKIATGVLLVFAVLGAAVVGLTHQSQAADPIEAPQRDRPQVDKPMSEMDKLQGTWVIVSRVEHGEDILEKLTKAAEAARDAETKLPKEPKEMAKEAFAANYGPMTIEGNKCYQGHGKTCEGTFKIDSTKDPKEWDYTETVSSGVIKGNKGVPILVLKIYKLEGDTLTICSRFAEHGRPTEFKSTKEGREVLTVHKRKPPAADKMDKDKLQGAWILESLTIDGKENEQAKGSTATFDGNKVLIKGNEENTRGELYVFKLDPGQNPKTIEMVKETSQTGKKLYGIYFLEEDKLTLAVAERDTERPKDFTAGQVLVLKRKQDKQDQPKQPKAKAPALTQEDVDALQFELAELRGKAKKLETVNGHLKRLLESDGLYGVLKKVDVKKNTVSVTLRGTTLALEGLPLAEGVKFFLGEKECKLDELKEGQPAYLELTVEGDKTLVRAIHVDPENGV